MSKMYSCLLFIYFLFKSIKKYLLTENSNRNELIPEEYFVYMNLYNNSKNDFYFKLAHILHLIKKNSLLFY